MSDAVKKPRNPLLFNVNNKSSVNTSLSQRVDPSTQAFKPMGVYLPRTPSIVSNMPKSRNELPASCMTKMTSLEMPKEESVKQFNPLKSYVESSTNALSKNNSSVFNHSSKNIESMHSLVLSSNIFENCSHMIENINRKNAKIKELEKSLAAIIISKDPVLIAKINSEIAYNRQELLSVQNSLQLMNEEKAHLFENSKQLEREEEEVSKRSNKEKYMAQSMDSIQNELKRLEAENKEYSNVLTRIEYESKIEFEVEYRKTLEKKLLDLTMTLSRNHPNENIQKLHLRLKEKYTLS